MSVKSAQFKWNSVVNIWFHMNVNYLVKYLNTSDSESDEIVFKILY